MEKQEVLMKNWNVSKWDKDVYNLCGIADKHAKLGNNVFVQYTSELVKAKIENDVLYYETKNTKYICPLKYMSTDYYKNTSEKSIKSTLMNLNDSELDKLVKIEIEISKDIINEQTKHILELTNAGQKEIALHIENEQKRLMEKVKDKPNSLYIEVSKIDSGDIASYNVIVDGKEQIGIVKPYLHSGMFQDSVIYANGLLDFRYFPGFNRMESYHWNQTIQNIYIENCLNKPITFNGIVIEPNEVEHVRNTERMEGLFSPDSVDGSNIFTVNRDNGEER